MAISPCHLNANTHRLKHVAEICVAYIFLCLFFTRRCSDTIIRICILRTTTARSVGRRRTHSFLAHSLIWIYYMKMLILFLWRGKPRPHCWCCCCHWLWVTSLHFTICGIRCILLNEPNVLYYGWSTRHIQSLTHSYPYHSLVHSTLIMHCCCCCCSHLHSHFRPPRSNGTAAPRCGLVSV